MFRNIHILKLSLFKETQLFDSRPEKVILKRNTCIYEHEKTDHEFAFKNRNMYRRHDISE